MRAFLQPCALLLLRLFYTLLTALALPLLFARLWWRGRQNPAYRLRWRERLGRYDTSLSSQSHVVFHAVSVGEVHAALPLIEAFLRIHPEQAVVVTTTTPTGSERVTQLLGPRVQHVYLPYDLPWCLQGFFQRFQPRLLVLLETELWPNLLQQCQQVRCPAVLVNARLSPKSLSSYRRISSLAHTMLQQLACISAQATADGERFVALGLPREKLQLTGSLKFDIAINDDKVMQARTEKAQWHSRPVWIAASTREGEDALVLQAHKAVLLKVPNALLVLVPRHLERFASAHELVQQQALRSVRRSSYASITDETQVLIGDSIGDMHYYYSLADIAFVGGSLVNTGCQNIIEAAALGLPVLTGPSLYNFKAASDALIEAGAMKVVADASKLGEALIELFQNQPACEAMAAQSRRVVADNRGATTRTLSLIETYWRNH